MLTDEEQITNRLLKRNGTHLSMSGDTPFASGPLADQIGKDGEGVAVEEMLKGSFVLDTSGLDEVHASKEMKAFLAALKIPVTKRGAKATPIMNENMTLENYIEAFNKTKEDTASSPSGIHYGHYKAACESDILSKVNLIFMVVPSR
jgi:hypothetical protein